MKKLDNKGWGLGIFIIYVCIFFAAILLVTHIATKNNLGADSNIDMSDDDSIFNKYKEYEEEIKIIATQYQKENYPDMGSGDNLTLSINKLNIREQILHRCTGYVVFAYDSGDYKTTPYIKCGSYRTSGYLSALDN